LPCLTHNHTGARTASNHRLPATPELLHKLLRKKVQALQDIIDVERFLKSVNAVDRGRLGRGFRLRIQTRTSSKSAYPKFLRILLFSDPVADPV